MKAGFTFKWIGGHYLCPQILSTVPKIVDIGANIGTFIQAARQTFSATIYALEPTPQLFEKLQSNHGVQKLHAAVSDQDGDTDFF